MENETSDKKKSLFEEWREAKKKAREEFKKLSPEEQKKYMEAQRHLQEKWDKTAYY